MARPLHVHIRLSRVAQGVAPEDAFAWWTDFHDGRIGHGRVATRRRILERAPDGSVRMEDRVVGLPFRETLTARPDAARGVVEFEGENTVSRFSGRYSFEDARDGTRIGLDTILILHAPLRFAAPIAAPIARRVLAHDLEGHVADMRRALNP